MRFKLKNVFKKATVLQVAIIYIFNCGCANIFNEMADKTTDKALLYETKLKLGKGEWDGALEQIALMSADYQLRRDIKVLKASAYAGKCGLNFVDLATSLQGGASGLFAILLQARTGATQLNLNNCIISEEILAGIASVTDRTVEENILMAFLGLIKVANILNIRADTNANGTVDVGWTPCGGAGNTNLPTSDVTRADATEIVTGIASFLTNITAAGAGASAGTFFTSLNTLCSGLGANNPCSVSKRSDVDFGGVFHTKAIRSLITGRDTGIGLAIDDCDSSGTGNPSNNICISTTCAAN